MPVKKGTGQMKDSGFSRPYGPFSAKEAKKIADAIEKGSTKKPAPKKPMAPRTASTGAKKPMPKVVGSKPSVKKPMPKIDAKPAQKRPGLKPATKGPAAIKAIQDRVSPSGVKKAEMDAKKAIDKKYPGLYKKSK